MKNPPITNPLFLEKIRILYNSEKQFQNYLRVIQYKSTSAELLALLNELIKISHVHISRLEFLFKKFKVSQQSATCETMNGLIRENLLLITHSNDAFQREYAIINFLQHANSYKITAYNWIDYYLTDQYKQLQAHYITDDIIGDENSITKCIAEVEKFIISPENSKVDLCCV